MKTNDKHGTASSRSLPRLVLLDDDRQPTQAGDTVGFNYGIPPVGVRAKIIRRGKSLIALTPGHTPAECNLRTLRKYVGSWYKQNAERSREGAPKPTK
jgi:hypothetical protein